MRKETVHKGERVESGTVGVETEIGTGPRSEVKDGSPIKPTVHPHGTGDVPGSTLHVLQLCGLVEVITLPFLPSHRYLRIGVNLPVKALRKAWEGAFRSTLV